MSINVKVKNAVKRYGDFTAVNQITLDIMEGEFFTLLGPSGCGKTTLLRMIAGFHSVDEGEIYFGDQLMNHVDAHKRNIGMVFQNYAIFPHLTVEENTAYGLKARKIPKSEIKDRVNEALQLVQIENLRDRKPNELSGGQQQRVALARAFVIEPQILLMDEPLSNLDAKLRVQMRTIIKKLQRRLGITTIYVTHDQEEALAISDRIAVMKEGVIMQKDAPMKVYKFPNNVFVAGFIGVSNFIDCKIESDHDMYAKIEVVGMDAPLSAKLKTSYSGDGVLSIRPEQLFFSDRGLRGKIVIATFLGDFVEYEIELESGQCIHMNEYTKDSEKVKEEGTDIRIDFAMEAARVYSKNNQEVLSL